MASKIQKLTEDTVVNLPCSVPLYVKKALYAKVHQGHRSRFITEALKEKLGLE